jgi:hypothetical protein
MLHPGMKGSFFSFLVSKPTREVREETETAAANRRARGRSSH